MLLIVTAYLIIIMMNCINDCINLLHHNLHSIKQYSINESSVTFSYANKNLCYYFNEIQHEKEGNETFGVSESPLPLSLKRPNV